MTGCPILDGVAGHLDCPLAASHDAGDHVIFIGEVQALAWRRTSSRCCSTAAATGS